MTEAFRRVCLVGCGLIGGSLALALRRSGQTAAIVGVDSDSVTLKEALRLGIVDEAADLEDGLREADLVVLAVPIPHIPPLLREVARRERLLAPGAIVTDTGSTKSEIVREARRLFQTASFVGGHPMAGSEKSGVHAAHATLLENAVYVLTPYPETGPVPAERLRAALLRAGARVKILEPDVHDRVVAAISHVPHVVAAALVNQVADLARDDTLYQELAAGGFRDITRIASSDPSLWRDIVLSNSAEVIPLIDSWIRSLHAWRTSIAGGDPADIERRFRDARTFRDALPVKSTGAIRAVYSMTVSVPDEPGVIGRIATLLGNHGVSIRNVGILESREEDDGQLLLQFDTADESERALSVLGRNGYAAKVRI